MNLYSCTFLVARCCVCSWLSCESGRSPCLCLPSIGAKLSVPSVEDGASSNQVRNDLTLCTSSSHCSFIFSATTSVAQLMLLADGWALMSCTPSGVVIKVQGPLPSEEHLEGQALICRRLFAPPSRPVLFNFGPFERNWSWALLPSPLPDRPFAWCSVKDFTLALAKCNGTPTMKHPAWHMVCLALDSTGKGGIPHLEDWH